MNDWIKQIGQFLMVALGIFCTLFILIQNPAPAAETGQQEEKEKLSLNAHAAVLMDADSGRILVRLAAHVSNGLKSRIRPVVGRI